LPASVAETDTLILPIHFPTPTVVLITSDGDRLNYRFKRDQVAAWPQAQRIAMSACLT
jgi:hypothetical protein